MLIELLKRHEGYSRIVYRCTANRQTIGFGRNLDDVGIDREEAEYLLRRDIQRAEDKLQSEGYFNLLSDVRKAVLISMVFNLGWGGFLAFQNMRARLRQGDFVGAASEMLISKWANQVKGRAAELAQMMEMNEWPK